LFMSLRLAEIALKLARNMGPLYSAAARPISDLDARRLVNRDTGGGGGIGRED
jgi:hypothetical protein